MKKQRFHMQTPITKFSGHKKRLKSCMSYKNNFFHSIKGLNEKNYVSGAIRISGECNHVE